MANCDLVEFIESQIKELNPILESRIYFTKGTPDYEMYVKIQNEINKSIPNEAWCEFYQSQMVHNILVSNETALHNAVMHHIKQKFTDEENDLFYENLCLYPVYVKYSAKLKQMEDAVLNKLQTTSWGFFNKKQKAEYESLRNKINKCNIKVQSVIANIEKLKHIYKNTFVPTKEFSEYLNRFLTLSIDK
jgi:uncharacterized short protein YbdD (DUF466 family)